MTIAQRIAERVLALDFDDLPSEAVHWAKLGILDTVAVTLAGAPEPCVAKLMATPGVAEAPGPCLLLGGAQRTSVLDACLVNGTASHALDFDDVNANIGGHPSVMLVPAILALGEARNLGGGDMIAAYVAGFELETRLGRAVNFHHYEKGWHPTVTLGIFGTVAAAGRLIGLDAERTATALALACSLASGIKANFGTMTKPLHVGHAVRNGVFAAHLAEQGFTASLDAFEEKQGFFEVFNGRGTYDAERVFDNWGRPFDVQDQGPGLKQYPCCGSTHAAIDCAFEILKENRVAPADIRTIEMLTNPRRLPHTDNPDPATGLEGKFSVHYILARAIKDGHIGLDHFTDLAVSDPEIRTLMGKVSTGAHPEMGADSPHQFGAEVIVTTGDGRRLSHRINHRVCRGPADPMSEEELRTKFSDCVSRSLPSDRIEPLYGRLMSLEALQSAATLTEIMRYDPASVRAAE